MVYGLCPGADRCANLGRIESFRAFVHVVTLWPARYGTDSRTHADLDVEYKLVASADDGQVQARELTDRATETVICIVAMSNWIQTRDISFGDKGLRFRSVARAVI